MREDFRSFGSDLRPKRSRRCSRRASGRVGQDGRGVQTEARQLASRPAGRSKGGAAGADRIYVRRLPRLDAPGDNPGSTHVADMDFREMPPATHELNPHLLHPKFAMPTEGGLGFRGAGSTVTHDYYDPMCSSLFCVLHTRVGIPITLSIVMASVASRAGLKVEFLNAPGHFRCGVHDENYVDPEKPGTNARHVVFTADPFEGFEATDPRKLGRSIGTVWERRREEDAWQSSSRPRATSMRMLNNLFLIYGTGHGVRRERQPGRSGSRDVSERRRIRTKLRRTPLRTGGWFDTPSSRSRDFW